MKSRVSMNLPYKFFISLILAGQIFVVKGQQYIKLGNEIVNDKNALSNSFKVDQEALTLIRKKNIEFFQSDIFGDTLEFRKIELRNRNYRIIDGNGKYYKPGSEFKVYKSLDNEKQITLSFNGDHLRAEFVKEGSINVLRPIEGEYVFESHHFDRNNDSEFKCGVFDNMKSAEIINEEDIEIIRMKNQIQSSISAGYSGSCVPVAFDISFDIFNQLGSVQNVENWLLSVFYHVVQMYQRHDINLSISEIRIFTSTEQDPLDHLNSMQEMLKTYPQLYGLPYDYNISSTEEHNKFLTTDIGPIGTSMRQYVCNRMILENLAGLALTNASYSYTDWNGIFYRSRSGTIYPTLGTSFAFSISRPSPNFANDVRTVSMSDGIRDTWTRLDLAATMAHEFGHTMGSNHEHEEGIFGGVFYPKLNNCGEDAEDAIGGIMSYCRFIDFESSFGATRGELIVRNYDRFLNKYWSEGANEYYCSQYSIEEAELPQGYIDSCSTNYLAVPNIFPIDNLGHSRSNFQSLSSNCFSNLFEDTWLSFIPVRSDVVLNFSEIGTQILRFQVISGTCAAATTLFCNDVTVNSSRFEFQVPTGVPVHIRISSNVQNTAFSARLEINYDDIPIALNNTCNDAIELDPNENCDYSLFSTNGLTLSTVSSGCIHPDNSFGNYDQWYKIVVPTSGEVTFRTTATQLFEDGNLMFTNLETLIEVYSGTCSNLQFIDCSYSEFNNNFTSYFRSDIEIPNQIPGETLYVRVLLNSSGNTVRSGLLLACAKDGLFYPENDFIANAQELAVHDFECRNEIEGNFKEIRTETHSIENSFCRFAPTKDLWYSFIVPETGNFNVLFDIRRNDYYVFLTSYFGIKIYSVDQVSLDTTLISCGSPRGTPRNFNSIEDGNFSPGDEILLQVRFEDYSNIDPDLTIHVFKVCIWDDTQCQDNLALNETPLGLDNEFFARNIIESQSILDQGYNLYQAENHITLNEGFSVEENVVFDALIEDCPHDNTGFECAEPIDFNIVGFSFPNSCPGPNPGGSFWYRIVAERDDYMIVSSCRQSTDTDLWIYKFDEFSCNINEASFSANSDNYGDDGQCQFGSYLRFPVVAGEVILIEWKSTHSSEAFNFDLNYECWLFENCD